MTTKSNGALAPSKTFLAAEAKWEKLNGSRAELINVIEGGKLALNLVMSPGDSSRVPDHLKKLAAPFMEEAEDKRDHLIRRVRKAHQRLGELCDGPVGDSYETYQGAQRLETNRIAGELQPRHRKIVDQMVKAVERLSLAIIAERELLAELKDLAPLENSMFMPPLGREIGTGALSDCGGPMNLWAQKIRDLKIYT